MNRFSLCGLVLLGVIIAVVTITTGSGKAYAESDVVIVANKSLPVDSLTKVELKNIFLGNTVLWNPDLQVNLVTLKNSAAHDQFVQKYTGKTPDQFSRWWKRMLFTGQGTIPICFVSEDAAIEYLEKTSGAIGYVSSLPSTDKVKIIQITNK